jgi:hypothetical protein
MAKSRTASKAASRTNRTTPKHTTAEDREAARNRRETRNTVEDPAGSGRVRGEGVEEPLPVEDRMKTPEQERLENNPQGTRVDGTTARHTEPLGPPAPGQRGVPGPERRVVPQGAMASPVSTVTGDDGQEFNTDTEEGMQAYKESLGKVIRVRAKMTGFIDNVRRRAGDVFDVREKEFSRRWMEPVDGKTPQRSTGAQKALTARNTEDLQDRHRDVMADKAAGRTPTPRSTGDREVGD